MSTVVDAYVMSWHLTQSPAFDIVLRRPLRPYITLEFHDIDDWLMDRETGQTSTAMFLQILPPLDAHLYYEQVIWVPMWDMSFSSVDAHLSKLPPETRIIDFSGVLSKKITDVSYPSIEVQFFFNPDEFEMAAPQKRSLLYWNRKSLYTKSQLQILCDRLAIENLFWRDKTDYILPPELSYSLGSTIGETPVTHIPVQLTRDAYLRYLVDARMFLAPRQVEGIGLAFLEAMASGCVVIAADQPTMNTYISHGETGFLVPINDTLSQQRFERIHAYTKAIGARRGMMMYQLRRLLGRFGRYQSPLALSESLLDSIASADLEAMGERAREAHYAGYSRWQRQLPVIAEFILEL